MLPLLEKVNFYIDSKKFLWSVNSQASARSRLRTCVLISESLDPREIFEELSRSKKHLYTIKTTLITASGFEKFLKNTNRIAEFMREYAFHFRNAYQDRTIRMTEEDFKKIVLSAPNDATHNMLVLLGYCGLRKSEALAARWEDFDPERYELQVRGKGKKIRFLPLNPRWFRGSATSGLIADGSQNSFRKFIRQSGYSFRDFRAYFATKMVKHRELTIKDAQELLGHSSIETTQRYVRVDRERVKHVLLKE
jgi:integrase